MPGMFDDLIPAENKPKVSFDDLIPEKKKVTAKRQNARQNVRNLGDKISNNLPGKRFREFLPKSGPNAYLTAPLSAGSYLLDEGIKSYANAYWGGIRGVPIAGAYVDEGIARAASNFGSDYDKTLEHVRALDDVSEKDYPVANTAGKLIGGLAGGYGIGANVITKGAPLLVNAARSGAAGAVVGAGHEFGEGEGGLNKRAEKALSGAKLGAGLGAAMPIAGAALTRPIAYTIDKLVGDRLTQFGRSADDAADAVLLNKIQRSGQEPKDILANLEHGQRSSVFNGGGRSVSKARLPETIADTSDAMQRFTGSVYRQGDEAANIIKKRLDRRQKGPDNKLAPKAAEERGQIEDIQDAFDRALLIRNSKGARKTEEELMTLQQQEGNALYKKAFADSQQFDISDALKDTMDIAGHYSGKIRSSLIKAVKLFNRGNGKKSTPVSHVMRFDNSKKELDDMIGKAKGNQQRELIAFKHRLLERVHKVDAGGNPTINLDYKKARDSWGSTAEMREAVQMGRDAFKKDSQDIIEGYKKLSPGQKKMFRIGASDGLRIAFANKGTGHDVSKVFDKRKMIEVLRVIVPNSKGSKGVYSNRVERLGEALNRYERMASTRNTVLGGSQTQKNSVDDLDFNGSVLTQQWSRFSGSPVAGVTREAITALGNKILGYRKDVALQLAKRLMTSSPEKQAVLLRRLQEKVGDDRYRRFIHAIDKLNSSAGIYASSSQ